MHRYISYMLFFGLLLTYSCNNTSDDEVQGDFLEPGFVSNEPVFVFEANNAPFIQAGVGHFYMFTEYELIENIHTFIARFAKLPSCTSGCEEELIIKINDFQIVETTSQVNIEEAIQLGEYNFGEGQDIDFSEISMEYTNWTGNTFRTDIMEQPAESFFRINSVSDYSENENGEPTKILSVNFNCQLRSVEDESILTFENGEATIAVAYPE